jgi:tetratricopeptide (TPR) repeat protein
VASDEPPGKVLPFERPRRFPADLDRLRRMLDDENVEFEESDVDEGFACAEAAIARGVKGGHEARADLLNIRAHRTLATGDTDAALTAWAALIASYPTYLQAYVMRAQLLGKRGDHEAALAELDHFIGRWPTDARGYLHRAKLYQAQGDGERALANFRRAAQLDRASTEAHMGVAQVLAAKGDARGAARAYARAAEEVLGDAESYNMRAFMHFVAGHDELALADYEASLALSPNQPDVVAWRGLCRLRLRSVERGLPPPPLPAPQRGGGLAALPDRRRRDARPRARQPLAPARPRAPLCQEQPAGRRTGGLRSVDRPRVIAQAG